MDAPVCGLRPVRAARWVRLTASQPGIVTLVPSFTVRDSVENRPSITALTAAWFWPDSAAIAATSSVRFSDLSAMICPPRTYCSDSWRLTSTYKLFCGEILQNRLEPTSLTWLSPATLHGAPY